MRKSFFVVIFGLAMLFVVGISGATLITITDTTIFTESGTVESLDYNSHGWGEVNRLDGPFDYVYWTHHYEFAPPAAAVIDGSLTLWLRDDSVNDPFEFAFGWAEDGTWGFGEVDTDDYTFDVNAPYLEDGSFSVVLASLWDDFYIDRSDLKITYNSIALSVPSASSAPIAPVPEPATMFLLGSGLIGISIVGRKQYLKER